MTSLLIRYAITTTTSKQIVLITNLFRKSILKNDRLNCNITTSCLQNVNKPVSDNNSEKKTKNFNENRLLTIPNVLTLSRIASVPFINYFALIQKHEYACLLFLVSGLTDFLDGYIARNFKNQSSSIGSILDPLADKLLIGSLTITLSLNSMLPLELAFLILSRDIALILYSLYVRYKIIDKPVTLSKYINLKKYSTVQVQPDMISKFNTILQLALITFTLPSVVFSYEYSIYLIALQYATGISTILSSISYLYKRGSYKVIK